MNKEHEYLEYIGAFFAGEGLGYILVIALVIYLVRILLAVAVIALGVFTVGYFIYELIKEIKQRRKKVS